MMDDATYYEQLAIGAEFLAEQAFDRDERAEHLRMARTYRRRALLAGHVAAGGTLH